MREGVGGGLADEGSIGVAEYDDLGGLHRRQPLRELRGVHGCPHRETEQGGSRERGLDTFRDAERAAGVEQANRGAGAIVPGISRRGEANIGLRPS